MDDIDSDDDLPALVEAPDSSDEGGDEDDGYDDDDDVSDMPALEPID